MLASAIMVSSMSASNVIAASGESWRVNLNGADIRAFISQVSEMTGKSFIIDPRVKGKVTVMSTEEISAEGVYELFESVLSVHGFISVKSNGVTKILPNNNAKQSPLPFVKGNTRAKGDTLMTKVIRVKNTSAPDMVPILRPMVPQYGHLAAIRSANTLIISDHVENIKRIEKLISQIDGVQISELEVLQLEHAWVGNIVELIERLEPIQSGKNLESRMGTSRVTVVAEERTNRLILKGEKQARQRIRVLVSELDQPTKFNSAAKVIYLRHANAADVADIIDNVINSNAGDVKTQGAKARTETSVQADETLNALVIKAEPGVLSEIKEIVDQLDVRRAQVLIEAAIVEVTLNDDDSMGVQLASLEKGKAVMGTNFSGANAMSDILKALVNPSSAAAVNLAQGITLGAGIGKDADSSIVGLVQAFSSEDNFNLLSTPSIMTLDNEEASIVVGQNVPFLTSSTTGTAGTLASQSIQREDVGITLKVVPQINDGDVVRLEVDQEVSSVSESAEASDIITNKRQITTTILADNGQTIVLGGLIEDRVSHKQNKIPIIGDLPFIGKLFSSSSESKSKKNLLVFLQPTIIRTSEIAEQKTKEKYEALRSLDLFMDEKGDFKIIQQAHIEFPEDVSDVFKGNMSFKLEE